MKKIANKIVYIWLRLLGFKSYMANFFGGEIVTEFFENPESASWKKRIWALKRGFLVDKINLYGLNEENYKDYLSDYDYYRIFPLNNRYAMWINDKLTLKYTLSKYNEFLPEYYCEIKDDGRIQYLMDWPNSIQKASDIEAICALLRSVKILAAKQTSGAAGEGFYKLTFIDDNYYVNDELYDGERIKEFLNKRKGYLFTEFVRQCTYYEQIYPHAAHTLRVQTVQTEPGKIECLYSFIRWGAKKEVCVGHIEDGIVAVVDPDNGMVERGFYMAENHQWENTVIHPETGVLLSTKVPNWDLIVEKCLEMHNYMNELEYVGFDVIVTEDSFKLCEINSHSGIRSNQRECPMFKNEKCAEYFRKKIVGRKKNGY